MAQPVRNNPALSPWDLDWDENEEACLVFGFREGLFRAPDGGVEYRQIPLTAEDYINPRVGDHLTQGNRHAIVSMNLYDMLEQRYETAADVMVSFDMKIRWGMRRLPSPSPDVAVIPDVRDREKSRKSFHVGAEKARPCLVIEVVSADEEGDERWLADYKTKVDIYRRAGVPEYLIVDPQHYLKEPHLRLTGYRLDARGRYRPIEPDAQGRLLSETTGVWFAIAPDRQDPWLIDAATGERLLTGRETRAARREAEQARQTAEERAAAAEERAAAAEAELARLRQKLGLGDPQP